MSSFEAPLEICHTARSAWFTHSHVWHDSPTCVTWPIQVWRVSFTCLTWIIDMWDMTPSHVWRDSFICGTWLIHTWDLTHSHVCRDSFTCMTWLIHVCDLTHSHVERYSFIPQTEEIGLKIITTAKYSNKFSREFPYISNTFLRESPNFQTGFDGSKRKSPSLKRFDENMCPFWVEGQQELWWLPSYNDVAPEPAAGAVVHRYGRLQQQNENEQWKQ